jgi:hypothetical protein
MVWRKADNWTAFTNGSITWINGPEGVQDRPNDVRFLWERESSPPAPPPPPASARTYTPEVRSMDVESGGPGGVVRRLVVEIDAEWARVWGWRPARPTTVYLFVGGYHMVEGLPAILGRPLSADQRQDYERNVAAFYTEDALTGGWAIVLNIANGMGTPEWETLTKGMLVRQYSYLMQREVANSAGPVWFREGLARLSANPMAPSDPALREETTRMYEARKTGTLPTLKRLHADWAGTVSISTGTASAARGLSFLAVSILAERVGGGPLMEVLRRTAGGEDFETALRAVAGYSVDQLDAECQTRLR